MWFWYKQTVEMLWEEKANQLFESHWISKWRIKMTDEERQSKEYLKMTEDAHWKIIHNWLDSKWIFHSHFWNESWQSWSKNIIIMMAKKKALWVKKWFPDYYIRIPTMDLYVNLYIELKKAPWKQWWWNWSTFKIEQAECLNELNKVPLTWVALCQWSEQAMNLIEDMISKLNNKWILELIKLWQEREIIDYTKFINW